MMTFFSNVQLFDFYISHGSVWGTVILSPFFGKQPVPFEFVKKIPIKPSGWEKNLQNWENTGLFWIGKLPVFGCKIGKKNHWGICYK